MAAHGGGPSLTPCFPVSLNLSWLFPTSTSSPGRHRPGTWHSQAAASPLLASSSAGCLTYPAVSPTPPEVSSHTSSTFLIWGLK